MKIHTQKEPYNKSPNWSFFFWKKFQPIASIFYDSSLLSNQDTNQFFM